AITAEPSQKDQQGLTAYAKGFAVGLYDFSKDGASAILQLPDAVFHLSDVAENLKAMLAEIRRRLRQGNIQALKAVDLDLYRLVDLGEYKRLTAYWQGRLTSRVILKYATLVEGGAAAAKGAVGATKLAVRLGKVGAEEVKALAGKVVKLVTKEAKTEERI